MLKRYEVTVTATGSVFVLAASPAEASRFVNQRVTMADMNKRCQRFNAADGAAAWADNVPAATDCTEAEEQEGPAIIAEFP